MRLRDGDVMDAVVMGVTTSTAGVPRSPSSRGSSVVDPLDVLSGQAPPPSDTRRSQLSSPNTTNKVWPDRPHHPEEARLFG